MISMNKMYRTRGGMPARVLCVDLKNGDYPVLAAIEGPNGREFVNSYTAEGNVVSARFLGQEDLIEIFPWSDIKIDARVMVRNDRGEELQPGHFAGVRGGRPTTWMNGETSWSSEENNVEFWNECIHCDAN